MRFQYHHFASPANFQWEGSPYQFQNSWTSPCRWFESDVPRVNMQNTIINCIYWFCEMHFPSKLSFEKVKKRLNLKMGLKVIFRLKIVKNVKIKFFKNLRKKMTTYVRFEIRFFGFKLPKFLIANDFSCNYLQLCFSDSFEPLKKFQLTS